MSPVRTSPQNVRKTFNRRYDRPTGVAEAVFAVLAGHGLIRNAATPTLLDTIGPSTWRIAALGGCCLFLLDTDREDRW